MQKPSFLLGISMTIKFGKIANLSSEILCCHLGGSYKEMRARRVRQQLSSRRNLIG